MKKILLFFFILTPLFCSAEQEMNYTVLPNLAYLSTLKVENEIQILEGLLPILIEDFAKDLNLSATPIPFSTAKEAREAAQKGSSPDVSSIDLIGGVYYDENTAQYMEYIYPAIYEDELLVVVPDKVKTKIYSLEDFQKLDVSLTAVVIDDFPLGSWWSQLIKDKNSRWREYVVTDNENYASPLKVEKVDSINEAMALVLKGTHYFVGSNLMLRDFLDRYPKVIHQINGQYIYG